MLPAAPQPCSGGVTLMLAGDVMLGRGIDQVLPQSCRPELYEPWVRDARSYVRLAERVNGPIPAPIDFSYPWGAALAEFASASLRLVNLETAITTSATPWPDKIIHYRMHPKNVTCLSAAGIDLCVLANNHVLDWGRPGLVDTLDTLDAAGIAHAGAGLDAERANEPAVLPLFDGRSLLVWALGLADSGIPLAWQASAGQSGVNLIDDSSEITAGDIAARKRHGDIVIVSIHWGGNWGYTVPQAHRQLARRLIDGGADLIHGHSSHHPIGFERYRDRPILYGCGDLINDYEGIGGHEAYRPDITMLVGCRWAPGRSAPEALWLTPLRRRRFTLEFASPKEADWLVRKLLDNAPGACPSLERDADGRLHWR